MSALKDMMKLCGVIVATAKLIDADYPAILVYLIITFPILLTLPFATSISQMREKAVQLNK